MPTAEPITLERELEFFERSRVYLLDQAAGKFVLIKDERVIGFFESELEAVRNGYRQFGNDAFLVKHVVEADVPLNFTAFNLGA